MKDNMPTKWNTTRGGGRVNNVNVWYEDRVPDKVLLGPKGEVISRIPRRRIGFVTEKK